jgi:hypothetical protein
VVLPKVKAFLPLSRNALPWVSVPSDYSKPYGLTSKWYSRAKRWAVDQDYVHKLSESERAWLDRFNREYHNGDLKKGDPCALHASDELRKDCYRRNNKTRRDLFSIVGSREAFVSIDTVRAWLKVPEQESDISSPIRINGSIHAACRFGHVYLSALQFLRSLL